MNIGIVDLTKATEYAVELSKQLNQPTIVAGAVAMAAYGYCRHTNNINILAYVSDRRPNRAIRSTYLTIGVDGTLKANNRLLDLLDELPAFVADASAQATVDEETITLFGHNVLVISMGHIITMKLISNRSKDIGDIEELIKTRMELGKWEEDWCHIKMVVTQHLGWYAARTVDNLAATAEAELA